MAQETNKPDLIDIIQTDFKHMFKDRFSFKKEQVKGSTVLIITPVNEMLYGFELSYIAGIIQLYVDLTWWITSYSASPVCLFIATKN